MPGPTHVIPLVGGLVRMVMDPYGYWENLRQQAMGGGSGLSYDSLVGKMMVFLTDADKCREVMAVNDPTRMMMTLHPSAKNILGPNNLAFMHGPEHKAIRKSFLSLFTRKALGSYVVVQDALVRQHLAAWLAKDEGAEREIRDDVRDLNQQTSQQVFLGPYLDDPAEQATFSRAYSDITLGFLAFPLCVPGTAVWRARQGRFYVLRVLEKAVSRSVEHTRAGGEPRCLLDYWTQRCLEESDAADAAGEPRPAHCTPARMADAMLDFLFASQDASTASLTWCVTLMADHPEILARVREEQQRVRKGDWSATVDGDTLAEMSYTRCVVKEVLRYRAPAPMVPQLALCDYPLTPEFTVPKGSLVMPSINAVAMQGFADAEAFDPERFAPERQEDIKHAKHCLTFGHGPHYCVGKEYAINQLTLFLALLSTACDWERRRTPDSDKWLYLPTIYPADSLVTFKPRA